MAMNYAQGYGQLANRTGGNRQWLEDEDRLNRQLPTQIPDQPSQLYPRPTPQPSTPTPSAPTGLQGLYESPSINVSRQTTQQDPPRRAAAPAESFNNQLQSLYTSILGRQPEPAAYTSHAQNPGGLEGVRSAILGSPEYANLQSARSSGQTDSSGWLNPQTSFAPDSSINAPRLVFDGQRWILTEHGNQRPLQPDEVEAAQGYVNDFWRQFPTGFQPGVGPQSNAEYGPPQTSTSSSFSLTQPGGGTNPGLLLLQSILGERGKETGMLAQILAALQTEQQQRNMPEQKTNPPLASIMGQNNA